MDMQEAARQLGQSPEQLQKILQSQEGQRLAQLVQNNNTGTGVNNTQAAAQALKQLLSQQEGRELLQRLARQLQL